MGEVITGEENNQAHFSLGGFGVGGVGGNRNFPLVFTYFAPFRFHAFSS